MGHRLKAPAQMSLKRGRILNGWWSQWEPRAQVWKKVSTLYLNYNIQVQISCQCHQSANGEYMQQKKGCSYVCHNAELIEHKENLCGYNIIIRDSLLRSLCGSWIGKAYTLAVQARCTLGLISFCHQHCRIPFSCRTDHLVVCVKKNV